MDVASSLHINRTPSQLISEQVPTPPSSEHHTPNPTTTSTPSQEDGVDDAVFSISQTFHPHSEVLPPQPDTIFSSSDNVFFYVHRSVIQERSTNNWNDRLPRLPASTYSSEDEDISKVIALPERASVLNIALHAVYGLSSAPYAPSLEDLSAAVDAMATYGISPKDHILPTTPLYVLILNQAPHAPLAAYILAASHDILSLAVSISQHLLSYPLRSLPEAAAVAMGPIYLKRLFLLHAARLAALKRLLPPPPLPHAPTASCSSADQTSLTHAWKVTAAGFVWDAGPDITSSAIEATFSPLVEPLTCLLCAESLAARVRQVSAEWSMVESCISSS